MTLVGVAAGGQDLLSWVGYRAYLRVTDGGDLMEGTWVVFYGSTNSLRQHTIVSRPHMFIMCPHSRMSAGVQNIYVNLADAAFWFMFE